MKGWPACPVRSQALERPDAEALVFEGQRWSWAELDGRVTALAQQLTAEGLSGGDGVALLSESSPALVVHLLALSRVGARAIMLNARLKAPELRGLVDVIRPRRIFASEALLAALPGAELLRAAPAAAPATERAPIVLHPSAGAVLFTSGTTGAPRPALLTHFAFRNHALASRERLGTGPGSRWLCNLPLFHVGGLAMLWRCVHDGSTLVLHPRFDVAAAARDLIAERITHASFVATSLMRLLELGVAHPPALKVVLVGGGPTPQNVAAAARAAWLPVRLTYGLTEACSQVCTQEAADGDDAGTPLPGYQVRIVSPDGAELPPGAEGEIQLKSPALMLCYLFDDAATRAAKDGEWLRTGDFGRLDAQGRLTVLGRRLDLLVRGGENVYPAEIEATLLQHPAVRDVGVTALDDDHWGQVPLALVVPSSADSFDEAALRDWCRGRMASFKVPTEFRPVAELPRNAMGKIDRRALVALRGEP
jgi:O-succinylbenzoic acid--CoA ligase